MCGVIDRPIQTCVGGTRNATYINSYLNYLNSYLNYNCNLIVNIYSATLYISDLIIHQIDRQPNWPFYRRNFI